MSLVHHVQLNQQGWWRKGVAQVLTGLLWRAHEPLTSAKIRDDLRTQLNVSMPADEVQTSLEAMKTAGVVSEVRPGYYRLSEQSSRELRQQAASGEAELARAKAFFCDELKKHCGASLDQQNAWTAFVEELTAAVRQTGANTFNLLTGEQIERREDWLIGFVQRFGVEQIDGLKAVVAAFFSSHNPDGKQYVLRLLTAYFFVESTQLSRRTIESIDAKRNKRKLRLYLDTNYLFSVLGLHDNPADDAALSLLELAGSARQYIDIKFVVAPHTLDEAQRTIHACLESAKRVQVSRALQSAATSASLPSALRKFFNAAASAGGALSPDDFFGPYARNLKTVLQRKGILVDDGIDVSKYRMDQRVVDDVLWQNEREQARTSGRQKSYEAIEHDVILWYAVNDQRPNPTESPFDAEAWVVTVDTRLAAFDKRKTPVHLGVPTALLPSSLAQLIQFWVPRSDLLEATLLDSLKLPLFFKEFDRDDERVTMRILGALSRYGDVDDLGVDTVREILVNDALRHRIKAGSSATDEEVLALVQEEIVQRNKALAGKLAEATKQVDTLSGTANQEAEARKAAEARATQEESARIAAEARAREEEEKRKTAEDKAKQEEAARVAAATALAASQAVLSQLAANERKKQFLWRFGVVVPALAVTSCLALTWVWPSAPHELLGGLWPRIGYAIAGAGIGLLGAWRAVRFVDASPEIADWWVAKRMRGAAAISLAFFGGGVLPGFAGDVIKKLLGIS